MARPGARPRRKAIDIVRAARSPKVGVMLGLGFSSGLPLMLIGNTLNYWLGDRHVDLAVIGFASWIGLSYSLKFIWGAVVDSVPPPLTARLGRRRGWMVLSQLLVTAGLFGMAASDPVLRLTALLGFGVAAALGAATQDAIVDAWRIESSEDAAELDLMTGAYSFGYKLANILTGSVILFLAGAIGWPLAYAAFAASMGVGLAAALFAKEPARADAALQARAVVRRRLIALGAVWRATAGPFIDFFGRLGPVALLILVVAATYHLADFLRGPVINPFYVEVGLSKAMVASIRLSVGIPTTLLGVAAGGLVAARFGHKAALVLGALMQPLAVWAFSILAVTGASPAAFAAVMGIDDFAMSFAGLALTVYISTLTTAGFTATQYALLTSMVNLSGKTLKGFSGTWVKAIAMRDGAGLTHAYATYFGYAALTAGVPALLLVLLLTWLDRRPPSEAGGLSTA